MTDEEYAAEMKARKNQREKDIWACDELLARLKKYHPEKDVLPWPYL